jgi:hypothetical protein
MAIYYKAGDDVLEVVKDMIESHHEELLDANIGVLMRDEAPTPNGVATYSKVRKVSDEERALQRIPYDFVIWFAQDVWDTLTPNQRRAAVDHELCHCCYGNGERAIVKHDIEEFLCVIQRHGFWRPGIGNTTERVIQQRLSFVEALGSVRAVDRDVLAQVGDIFPDEEK